MYWLRCMFSLYRTLVELISTPSTSDYRDEPPEGDETTETHGHVNSISVLRSYRRLGLAKKLMLLSRMLSIL